MLKNKKPIDRVRPSRDGHEYHETWAARHAMQLLLPSSNLVGIAIEGLEPGDQNAASEETVEIADLVFYYGCKAKFEGADKVCIVQFKYSIRNKLTPYRAADAKKTIEKFGESFRSLRRNYGEELVRTKITFEIHTNRPIYQPLVDALDSLAKRKPVAGEVKKQADQLQQASGLSGEVLAEFAGQCHFQSLNDTLPESKSQLSRTVVDWFGHGVDALARASLGDLKQLIRNKAGFAGTDRNVIEHTDILAVFGLSDASDLLPCPESLVDVGEVVNREQLAEALKLVPGLDKPLMVHAAGGVGKTVFMDSLCRSLSDDHETVFFDCFGGGNYRSPGDARHHPRRGLIHIANMLACRGLCDPILPGGNDVDALINTFRRRMEQTVATLALNRGQKKLILFVDAMDNAALHAKDKHEDSFPVLLIEHLNLNPIPGFIVVLSSRTERIPVDYVTYIDFELRNFSLEETKAFICARIPDVKDSEIRVAHARSIGKPRVLQYMLESGKRLFDESEISNKLELNDLIQARIDSALSEANLRGSKPAEIKAFLAGLSALPPPVPVNEYANAHGLEVSAVESFATDLWPLLERTNQGMVFRDEPTEDLVRERYGSQKAALRLLAENLLQMQETSVYASRSLPDLLLLLGDGRQLFKLAFDLRFPETVTGSVGKRIIRLSRIKAAIRHAAIEKNYNQLVELTVEMSTLAAVDRRGTDYLLDYPDLVVAAQDTDATRRLFEARTNWQGARHARLSIANTLAGDYNEALRHCVQTQDWLRHHYKTDRDSRTTGPGPQTLDHAAISFYFLSQKRFEDAAGDLERWKDWYMYRVCEQVLALVWGSQSNINYDNIKGLVAEFSRIGTLVAALAHLDLQSSEQLGVLIKLSKASTAKKKLEVPGHNLEGAWDIIHGLRKATSIALALNDRSSAMSISKLLPIDCPGLWVYRDHHRGEDVFPLVFRAALSAAISDTDVHEKELMPSELIKSAAWIKNTLTGIEFRNELNKRLDRQVRYGKAAHDPKANKAGISYEEKQKAEYFLNYRFEPLLDLTRKLSSILRSPAGKADGAFRGLVNAWDIARKKRDYYLTDKINPFFQRLGLHIISFTLWARDDLKAASVKVFLIKLHEQERASASTLIDLVSIFSRRTHLHEFAGQEAVNCVASIELEDEVQFRASLYARLARAILPACIGEASEYFRTGLNQMDAIGSGDYRFTNSLFNLASSVRGEELADADFHTLTNIAELNLSDEPHKFPWFLFGKGMSKIAGCKGLAKLSRWDDRDKVTLSYTLMPYLTALLGDGKIEPEDALALNCLANPVENWFCNTETFAKALFAEEPSNAQSLVTELVKQYEANNPGLSSASTVKALAELTRNVLGSRSKIASRLNALSSQCERVFKILNEHANLRSSTDFDFKSEAIKTETKNKRILFRIAKAARPGDKESLCHALESLRNNESAYSLRMIFFNKLRVNVGFSDRAAYIRSIAESEHLNLHWKLDELKQCKDLWSSSSSALRNVYRDVANGLVAEHSDDLISDDYLSPHYLVEISALSGVSLAELVLELINLLTEHGSSVQAPVWLDFASILCEVADEGKGQSALTRLLRSDAAKLSGSVLDGEWNEGSYPKDIHPQIFSGLIWRQLGAPRASDRWRAAHCIRSFARFGRWEVLDALVRMSDDLGAGPFQAPELKFYYLHARLWLLIAMARISKDLPAQISAYKPALEKVIESTAGNHVLIRHFAAQALVTCIEAGEISVDSKRESVLRNIDASPFPMLQKRLKSYGGDYHDRRPNTELERPYSFYLDYEFNKEDVNYLSDVFGQPHWTVVDRISAAVEGIDPSVEGMHDAGGRDGEQRLSRGLSKSYHGYGGQLGWHAMMIAAGELLKTKPVTKDWFYDAPWQEWLSRYLLTRPDGFWLSDATNQAPLDVSSILMERHGDELALTGDKEKILGLAGLGKGVGNSVIVEGMWYSADHVKVRVNSALVHPSNATNCVKELLAENPMIVWLPSCDIDDDGNDYIGSDSAHCRPWITIPRGEPCLDGENPISSPSVMNKPRIVKEIAEDLGLQCRDPFGCKWTAMGGISAESEAWKYSKSRTGGSGDGQRLVVNRALVESLLAKNDSDLLLLIQLEKSESRYGSGTSRYWHSVAVVQIKKSLKLKYHKGVVNKKWVTSY